MGSTDPNTPIANGWLRASHRRLDPQRSKPWRPYHSHDRVEALKPGEIYECDVEIVTSSIEIDYRYDDSYIATRQHNEDLAEPLTRAAVLPLPKMS